jgi:long-chain acyl-CoA synthetase
MGKQQYRVDRPVWPSEVPNEPQFRAGKRPLHEYISVHAENDPDGPALTYYGRSFTWGELDELVTNFARNLVAEGYRPDDVCAIHLQNCPQFFVAYYGAQRAGLTVSPLNPQYKPPALRRQLQDNEAPILVTNVQLLDSVTGIVEDTDVAEVLVTEYDEYAGTEPPIPKHPMVADEPDRPDDAVPFDRFTSDVPDEPELPDVDLDDLALLQYTGGTSGLPKGVKHTHWNVLFTATTVATVHQFGREETHLGGMPLFHIAGKLIHVDAPVVSGTHTVLLARYTPEAMIEGIDHYDVNYVYATIPMIEEILAADDIDEYDLSSLSKNREQTFISSLGSNLTQEHSDSWERVTGTELQEMAYGLTETHTFNTNTVGRSRIEPEKGVFCGQPNYGDEIEIRDFETNEPLPAGEEGEIVVKSPSMMKGYLKRPEETDRVLESTGFLHTGDIGKLTEEGFLYFLGRQKDVIKVSGHTVAPKETELILENDDRIADAVVVGKPHETRGSVLEAHVVPAADDLTEADVISMAEDKLAEYKRPKSVVFVDSFPKTDVGKVDRVSYYEDLPDEYE